MNKKLQCYMVLTTLLLLISTYGCSKPSVHQIKITGKVTLDGKPLNGGSIKFIACGGETPSGGGTILDDGSYEANVPPGKKKVLVVSYKVVGKEPEYQGVPDSPMREKRVMVTHGIYNVAHRTPLEADVPDHEQNGLDFKLVSNPST